MTPIKRWIVFNSVGAMGIVVQMLVLWALASGAKLGYLPATGLAVETAVLHNFLWHMHWTWSDRRMQHNSRFVQRLLYFHFANGTISLAGNLALMRVFVEKLGLHYMLANALAVGLCSILNFLAGDRIVFRSVKGRSRKRGGKMPGKNYRIAAQIFFLFAATFLFKTNFAKAADLQPNTLRAWRASVAMTERRIASELSSRKGFLALDFLDSQAAINERKAVLSGEIPISQVNTANSTQVPDGLIHHWRGSVFIPGVPLDFVLSRVKNPNLDDTKQEDVLDSKVLERFSEGLKLYLKLRRSKIVTVVYNTEHLVRFQMHGQGQASSSSVATKISEIEHIFENGEREKPEGHDRGFLWRMNSYWRYQQVEGGVIVECESMTLSRSIPFALEYVVRPLINSTARESMHRTLQSMRIRIIRAYRSSQKNSES
jgi:putative flippase GtrA